MREDGNGKCSYVWLHNPFEHRDVIEVLFVLVLKPRSIVLKGLSLVRTGEAHARSYHTDGDSWVFMREGLVGGNQNHGGK
jgi:hypothetical protein